MSGRGELTNPAGGSQATLRPWNSAPTIASAMQNRYSNLRMRGILHKPAAQNYSHMKRNRPESLNPRKRPQQRRSRVTIDTIFEATIQVLLANGLDSRCKTRRPDVSRALYLPSAAVNAETIVREESSRCAQAVHDMLITASDATFAQAQLVSDVLIASIVGPTRAAIEAGGDRGTFEGLKLHLTALCVGYLRGRD
jgi:hypothetical protein